MKMTQNIEHNQTQNKLILQCFVLVGYFFTLVVNGAIPFVTIPTLGQAVWTAGFAQSYVNQSVFALYASNFGTPEPAAIAFGLAGSFVTGMFMRIGFSAADSYTLMYAFWLLIAYLGCHKISAHFKVSRILATLLAVLWLCLPIVWWHARYSMVALGFSLLPFYFSTFMYLLTPSYKGNITSAIKAGLFIVAANISIFMDGYTFIMFASGTAIVLLYKLIFYVEERKYLIRFVTPIYIVSLASAYFLYASFLGKTGFDAAPIDFFRAWGADLLYFTIPTSGVLWFWDYIGLSAVRPGSAQFGDASVWKTTFILPYLIVGFVSWLILRKQKKLATAFLIVAIFGLYMAMGPSVKFNSNKSPEQSSPMMSQDQALMLTGSEMISRYLPGFNNMRASYRWIGLALLGFWLLLNMASSSRYIKSDRKVFLLILLLISMGVPNISAKMKSDINQRKSFSDIDNTIAKELRHHLNRNERIAFLPYRNDFFVNYLASFAQVRSYNIGGDKNLFEARKHWPESMQSFQMGKIDGDFVEKIIRLFHAGDVDAIVLPYIDMLCAAHKWPAPLKFKNDIDEVVDELKSLNVFSFGYSDFFVIIRNNNTEQLPALLKSRFNTIKVKAGENTIRQIGSYNEDTGTLSSDGLQGFLVFGPYQSVEKGNYHLVVEGGFIDTVNATIDVVSDKGKKVHSKFILKDDTTAEGVLLDTQVFIDDDVSDLEIRIWVSHADELNFKGYSLKPN